MNRKTFRFLILHLEQSGPVTPHRIKRAMKLRMLRQKAQEALRAVVRSEVSQKAREIEEAWNPNNQLQNMVNWAVSKRAVKPELNAADFPAGYFDSLSGKGGVTLPGDEN